MFWDVHMHKITFMEGRTKKQERLEIKLFKWKKQIKKNQQNSKSFYEIHKLYFLRTGMDSLAYVTTVFKSSMTDWQVIN